MELLIILGSGVAVYIYYAMKTRNDKNKEEIEKLRKDLDDLKRNR